MVLEGPALTFRQAGQVEPVRVGGIGYLNALPLTRYLVAEGNPALSISRHLPGALAEKLRCGELDIALVPVVEYLARKTYRVLPGISIASYGEVRSIRFFHRRELSQLRCVGIDDSSRTSAALTRILLHDLWKSSPEVVSVSPSEALRVLNLNGKLDGRDELDALLLIGDSALAVDAQPEWSCVDLGTEWTRWTGLPFVYAFWVWHGGPAPAGLVHKFTSAKKEGLARIDDIVREHCAIAGEDPIASRHYLHRTIQYDLNSLHVEGLLEYVRRLDALKILPRIVRSTASSESLLQWVEESP